MAKIDIYLFLLLVFSPGEQVQASQNPSATQTVNSVEHFRPLAPCVTTSDEAGICVHKSQCPGYFDANSALCQSPTGRKLVCCTSFSYKLPEQESDCGIRPSVNSLRKREMVAQPILGGVVSQPLSWPWLAALYNKEIFICGGALISKNCVLTAAHCFDSDEDEDEAEFYVRLGEHSLLDDAIGEYPEEYKANKVTLHPNYEDGCSDYDLAVIRLNEPARETPVCLPHVRHRYNSMVNKTAVVSGWGTVVETQDGDEHQHSIYLQEITIPILETSYCHNQYKSIDGFAYNFKNGVDQKFLCAGHVAGGKDACQGDSGGPLMAELEPNKWSLVGVVCIGFGCGQVGYPGIYTKVTHFQNWIEKTCGL